MSDGIVQRHMQPLAAGLCIALLVRMLSAGTITEFLLDAYSGRRVRYQDKKIDYLQNSPKDAPFIDELEFRVRNTGYEFERQRYMLRLEPNGFGETRRSRQVSDARIAYERSTRDALTNRRLKKSYQLVVEYLYRRAVLDLRQDLKAVYEDRLKVLSHATTGLDFDLDDYIITGDELLKVRLQTIGLENTITRLRSEIESSLPSGDSLDFDTSQIVGVAGIDSLLRSNDFTLDTNNVHLRRSYARLKFEESRYHLETAQSRRFLNYIQFGFDHDALLDERERRDEGTEYNLARSQLLSVGLNIPVFNADRLDVNRRKIKLLDEQDDHSDLMADLAEEIEDTKNDMNTLLAQYDLLVARKEEMKSESFLKKYMGVDGVDPLIVLRTKESLLKHDVRIEEAKLDLYREYLKLLDITGLLSSKPLVNYLSKSRELLAQ